MKSESRVGCERESRPHHLKGPVGPHTRLPESPILGYPNPRIQQSTTPVDLRVSSARMPKARMPEVGMPTQEEVELLCIEFVQPRFHCALGGPLAVTRLSTPGC